MNWSRIKYRQVIEVARRPTTNYCHAIVHELQFVNRRIDVLQKEIDNLKMQLKIMTLISKLTV